MYSQLLSHVTTPWIVNGIFQVRILEWFAMSSLKLRDQSVSLRSSALADGFFTTELPWKPLPKSRVTPKDSQKQEHTCFRQAESKPNSLRHKMRQIRRQYLSLGGCELSGAWLVETSWTVALQAPLSMEFFQQEYQRGLPFPSPGDLPDPRIEPKSPAIEADSLPLLPLEKPSIGEKESKPNESDWARKGTWWKFIFLSQLGALEKFGRPDSGQNFHLMLATDHYFRIPSTGSEWSLFFCFCVF